MTNTTEDRISQSDAITLTQTIVNKQNCNAVLGGGGVGLLGGVIYALKNEDDNSEALAYIAAGLGGGLLGQAVVFFTASREESANPVLNYLQNRCIWLMKTPLPAIAGGALMIGASVLFNSKRA